MSLNSPLHQNIMVKILSDIYKDKEIAPYLGFKGGTAAYLFYGLERFSVDLDFDLLDETKENFVFEKIIKIIQPHGTIKQSDNKRFNLFFLLSYNNKKEGAQNVKIEINKRPFGSKYKLKSFMGISMLVMIEEDMFANKLIAMYERLGNTNRDIFDVWYFSKNDWSINRELVEKRAEIPFKEFLKKCLTALENFDDHNILDGMGELLNEKQKNWVKTKLKDETLFLLKLELQNEM